MQPALPKKTVKGLKIKRYIPLQTGPVHNEAVCICHQWPGVRRLGGSLFYPSFFPEQTEQTLAGVVL